MKRPNWSDGSTAQLIGFSIIIRARINTLCICKCQFMAIMGETRSLIIDILVMTTLWNKVISHILGIPSSFVWLHTTDRRQINLGFHVCVCVFVCAISANNKSKMSHTLTYIWNKIFLFYRSWHSCVLVWCGTSGLSSSSHWFCGVFMSIPSISLLLLWWWWWWFKVRVCHFSY